MTEPEQDLEYPRNQPLPGNPSKTILQHNSPFTFCNFYSTNRLQDSGMYQIGEVQARSWVLRGMSGGSTRLKFTRSRISIRHFSAESSSAARPDTPVVCRLPWLSGASRWVIRRHLYTSWRSPPIAWLAEMPAFQTRHRNAM